MRNIILVLIAFTMITACGRRYCERKFPHTSYSTTTVIDSMVIDTLFLPMKADTCYIEVPMDCPDTKIALSDHVKDTHVIIKDKILYIKNITKADTIAILTANRMKLRDKEVIRIVEVKYFPKWAKWLLTISVIFCIFAIVSWRFFH